MHVLISGGTGFLGKKIIASLLSTGYTVSVVTRDKYKAIKKLGRLHSCCSILERDSLSSSALGNVSTVINLAGASILSFPRNRKQKKRIYNSRIYTTRNLVGLLPSSCTTFICASATGYYPPNANMVFDAFYHNTHPSTFLEKVCVDRENEAKQAKTKFRRVVILRTGVVLGNEKTAKRIHTATKRLGGIIIGSGEQWMPLIRADYRVKVCMKIITSSNVEGPINMVEINMKHKDYLRSVAHYHNKPIIGKIPGGLVKRLLGKISILTLGSRQVEPVDLQAL